MNKSLKKILDVVSSILVALVVILALLLVGARVVGLQVFTVLSGSMEPTYHTGSLLYVKKVDPYTIEVGQPITFMMNEDTVATHRVVGIVPDDEDPTVIRFRTKGDANEAEDGGLVHYKNVIGTPVFSIPYLGYVAPTWHVHCHLRRRGASAAGVPSGYILGRQEQKEENRREQNRAVKRRTPAMSE